MAKGRIPKHWIAYAFFFLALAHRAQAQQAATNALTPKSYFSASTATNAANNATAPTLPQLLNQTYQLQGKGDFEGAIAKANAALQLDPQSVDAYLLRGSIYAQQKKWTEAERDCKMALSLAPASPIIKFNLAELKFLQKSYDDARPGFVALLGDKDWGDLAAYKVFLCDLLAGHEDAATKELNAFNQVGGNPSYYFSNASWDLVHHQTEEARHWLMSAAQIYGDNPKKFSNYATSLKNLGYLPLPPAPSEH